MSTMPVSVAGPEHRSVTAAFLPPTPSSTTGRAPAGGTRDTLPSGERAILPVRVAGTAATPERAAQVMGTVWGGSGWRSRFSTGVYAFRFLAVGDTRIRLARSQMNGHICGRLTPDEDYVVATVTSGDVAADLRTSRSPMRVGLPALWSSSEVTEFDARNHDVRLVRLERAFVRGVAAAQFAVPAGELRFISAASADHSAVDGWRSALKDAAHVLSVQGVHSAAWDTAVHAVAAAFLLLFPPETGAVPDALRQVGNARVLRAVDYLHAHPMKPVTLAEVCAASGFSPRGLQESFQRSFGAAPLAYHRGVRLEQVRTELLRADPDVTTVGVIARRYGFAHLGRFSAAYTSRYGEYPKTTLRR